MSGDLQQNIANRLRGQHIEVPRQWLAEQISSYRNRNSPSSGSRADLTAVYNFVLQQWLCKDLEDWKLPTLPAGLDQIKSTTLPKSYALQMNSKTDIGHSCYSQLCKLRRVDEVNLEVTDQKKHKSSWEPKGSRMLRLQLTDGVQTISAIEYVPVTELKLTILPGSKILIRGPVECRRGVILLRPENVTLLGGQVEKLFVANAPENILARAIQKQQNPDPVYGDIENPSSRSQVMSDSNGSNLQSTGLLKRPACHVNPPAKRPSPCSFPADLTDSYDELLATVEIPDFPATATQQPKPVDDLLDDDIDDLLFEAMDDVDVPVRPAPKMPFTYLAAVIDERSRGNISESFHIKGFVSTIVGKLEAVQGRWHLTAQINDGTAALEVSFQHEVLEKVIGYSPLQMRSMMRQGDAATRLSVLQSAKKSLLSLNCLLHISWPLNCQRATVIGLEDVSETHLAQVAR